MSPNFVFLVFLVIYKVLAWFVLVFFGFSMVFARLFCEIIGFSMVFFGFSLVLLVLFGFSLVLLVLITRMYGFFWFYHGYPRVSFGSRLVFQWFRPGCTAPGYSVSSLRPTQERVAGAAQKCSRRSGAPKSFKMIAFESFS